MAVDYTPTLGTYTELKPFRYWCQKVLPLVYDDSLSYYELLCKVVDYLNKTMEDVETLHDDVDNLHTAYEQLQEYVNDYFDNLDVQEEINNKLDALVEDGTMTALLSAVIGASAMPVFVSSTDDMTDTEKIYVVYSSGYVYYYNGSEWVNTNIVYGTSNALILPFSRSVTSSTAASLGISSVDSQPVNTLVTYAASFIALETSGTFPPNCQACNVLCYAGVPGATNTIGQLCSFILSGENQVYFRSKSSTTWTSWVDVSNAFNLKTFGTAITSTNYSAQGITSIDTQPVNTIVTYSPSFSELDNVGTFPAGLTTSCTVFTFNGTRSLAAGSVQLCCWNNSCAYRYLTSDGWSTWVRTTTDDYALHTYTNVITSSNYSTLGVSSVDTQPNNTVYTYAKNYVDLGTTGTFPPNCQACTVICYVGTPESSNSMVQFCSFIASSQTLTYVRMKSSQAWTNWMEISNSRTLTTFGTAISASNYVSKGISSIDAQPANTVITYAATFIALENVGTFPPGCTSACTVFTFNGQTSLVGGAAQIAAWSTGTAVRFLYSGGWTAWTTLREISVDELRFAEVKSDFVSTCVNKPINMTNAEVFIFGDSIASASHGGFTWGSIVCDKFSATEHNYAVSGAPFNEASDNAIINQITTASDDLPEADVIFVCGGVNDWSVTNYTNLRSYVQNVIDAIRELNETAEIIFITPTRATSTDTIATRLPNICSVICNTALMNQCSVINGYEFPIPTDTTDVYIECTDNDHLHPSATYGKWIYAASVLNAIV